LFDTTRKKYKREKLFDVKRIIQRRKKSGAKRIIQWRKKQYVRFSEYLHLTFYNEKADLINLTQTLRFIDNIISL